MKVHGNDPIARLKEILDRGSVGQTRPVQSDRPSARADRVELSAAAKEFHAVREAALQAPEVRASLVASLQERLTSGGYQPNTRTIAAKLLEDLGGVPSE